MRRHWPRRRKAVLFRRAALGCYAVAVALAGLTFVWLPCAWLAAGVALIGLWCQRGAIFARRLEDHALQDDNVPGD